MSKRDKERLILKRAVRRHYELARPVMDEELDGEVANLKRRNIANILDDEDLVLFVTLGLDREVVT